MPQGAFEAYLELCHRFGCPVVEVSNGTCSMSHHEKAEYIERASSSSRC